MNREIKFRGKRMDNGEWVYGDLLQPTEIYNIYKIANCESIDGTRYEVTPETIGQYTGLHDKNGKEIYEGDIVSDNKIKWIVRWNKHRMGFSLYPTTEQLYDEMPINVENKLSFKILGNIYDNPDLVVKE